MALVLVRIWVVEEPPPLPPEIFVQGRVLVRSGWSYGVGLACGRFNLGHSPPRVPCVDKRQLLGRGIAFSPSSISESQITTWNTPFLSRETCRARQTATSSSGHHCRNCAESCQMVYRVSLRAINSVR